MSQFPSGRRNRVSYDRPCGGRAPAKGRTANLAPMVFNDGPSPSHRRQGLGWPTRWRMARSGTAMYFVRWASWAVNRAASVLMDRSGMGNTLPMMERRSAAHFPNGGDFAEISSSRSRQPS